MPWTHVRNPKMAEIVRWAYLIIVVSATIALATLLKFNYELVDKVNEDRKLVTYEVCLDQNARHNELEEFLVGQGRNRRNDPLLFQFVDLLAPKLNCEELVQNRFGSSINPEATKNE